MRNKTNFALYLQQKKAMETNRKPLEMPFIIEPIQKHTKTLAHSNRFKRQSYTFISISKKKLSTGFMQGKRRRLKSLLSSMIDKKGNKLNYKNLNY